MILTSPFAAVRCMMLIAVLGHSAFVVSAADASICGQSGKSHWSGLYVGGHVGGVHGEADADADDEDCKPSGTAIGAHVGYSIKCGQMVIGLEGDYSFLDANDDARLAINNASFVGFSHVEMSSDYLASARLRVGVVVSDLLVFVTGGIASINLDVDEAFLGTDVSASGEDDLTGYVIGGGVEGRLWGNFNGRVELLHYVFSDDIQFRYNDAELDQELGPQDIGFDYESTVFRIGASYQFSDQ